MAKRESLEIFAKHFGTILGIQIVFGETGPSTDGKTIYLPENLSQEALYPCLGALLHETGHIRMTDFTATRRVSSEVFPVLNLLEDIRIDTNTLSKYPETRDLYKRLLSFAMKDKAEAFKAEPFGVKVLKHLYIEALGFEGYEPKASQFIKEAKLERFIKSSRVAPNTHELISEANELYSILFAEQKRQLESGESKETLEEFSKSLQDKKKKTSDKYKELGSNNEKEAERLEKSLREITSAKSSVTRYSKNVEKAEEANDLEKLGKLETKLADAEARLEDAEAENAEANANMNQNRSDMNKEYYKEQNVDRVLNQLEPMRSDAEKARALLESGQGFTTEAITGFDALSGRASSELLEVEFPISLDETVREVFLDKKESNVNVDEGYRINSRKITGIITGEADIYEELKEKEEETLLTFLIDCSGSMGRPKDKGSRSYNSLNALNALLKSVTRVKNQEDVPLKVSVESFNHATMTILGFDEAYSEALLKERYYAGGGTDLTRSLVEAYEKLQEESAEAKKIIVVLTDGDVNYNDLADLDKNTFQDTQVIYIGLDVRGGDACTKLFGNLNIRKTHEILPVVSEALLKAIENE
jgi:uncharacterized protein with von Willebrand factor type A (vWA) domain